MPHGLNCFLLDTLSWDSGLLVKSGFPPCPGAAPKGLEQIAQQAEQSWPLGGDGGHLTSEESDLLWPPSQLEGERLLFQRPWEVPPVSSVHSE